MEKIGGVVMEGRKEGGGEDLRISVLLLPQPNPATSRQDTLILTSPIWTPVSTNNSFSFRSIQGYYSQETLRVRHEQLCSQVTNPNFTFSSGSGQMTYLLPESYCLRKCA